MIYKLKKFAKMTKMILNQVKDTKQLFQMLNISKQTLSEEQRNSLNDKGFVILSSTNYMLNKGMSSGPGNFNRIVSNMKMRGVFKYDVPTYVIGVGPPTPKGYNPVDLGEDEGCG